MVEEEVETAESVFAICVDLQINDFTLFVLHREGMLYDYLKKEAEIFSSRRW